MIWTGGQQASCIVMKVTFHINCSGIPISPNSRISPCRVNCPVIEMLNQERIRFFGGFLIASKLSFSSSELYSTFLHACLSYFKSFPQIRPNDSSRSQNSHQKLLRQTHGSVAASWVHTAAFSGRLNKLLLLNCWDLKSAMKDLQTMP